jgi:hypothetical protein
MGKRTAVRFVELIMELQSRHLVRVFGLLWSRMGRARIFVAVAAIALVIFAAVGVAHLFSPRGEQKAAASQTPNKMSESLPDKPVISITEIGTTESKGRNGRLSVALKIGVAPITDARKGEVEIRVAFFDVNAAGEMRPTNAQVDYEWLTPVRNWADPAPKYLVATYQGASPARDPLEQLRYGGFLVRVYFDGRLQAERSEPKELVASLRNRPSSAPSEARTATPTPRAIAVQSRAPEPRPVETLSPPPLQTSSGSSAALPYGSPVPDKPGFVYSPYDPKFLIDVRGFPPGTEVTDPNTSKRFKVP